MALYQLRKDKKGKIIRNFKGNKNPEEIFYETSQRLFKLLSNHPYFIENIESLRNYYKIPAKEIRDISELLIWKNNNKNTVFKIQKEQKVELFLKNFSIPQELQKSVIYFAYDFLMTNNIITASSFASGLNVIRVTEDTRERELNPNHLYLEITPFTSLREVKDKWEVITNTLKSKRNFGIPSTTKHEEFVWKLSQQGLTTKQITEKINQSFKTANYLYNEVLKLKSNYKKALSTLKTIE
jgi:hypothetical protein